MLLYSYLFLKHCKNVYFYLVAIRFFFYLKLEEAIIIMKILY